MKSNGGAAGAYLCRRDNNVSYKKYGSKGIGGNGRGDAFSNAYFCGE